MLKPKPRKTETPSPDGSPREAARALLSMLGEGAPASGKVSDAQMRRLAQDLIAQVEGRSAAQAAPSAGQADARPAMTARKAVPNPRRTLFSRAAPLVPPPAAETPAPVVEAPPPPSEPQVAAAGPARAWSPADLPETFAVPVRQTRRTGPPAMFSLGQVRTLALKGIAKGEAEHPAILALVLQGKPPLEQAVALRALPRGQARAVHRALRMMEGRGGG